MHFTFFPYVLTKTCCFYIAIPVFKNLDQLLINLKTNPKLASGSDTYRQILEFRLQCILISNWTCTPIYIFYMLWHQSLNQQLSLITLITVDVNHKKYIFQTKKTKRITIIIKFISDITSTSPYPRLIAYSIPFFLLPSQFIFRVVNKKREKRRQQVLDAQASFPIVSCYAEWIRRVDLNKNNEFAERIWRFKYRTRHDRLSSPSDVQ